MADFQEVGKQWARMCKAFRPLPNGCSGCPLVDEHCYHEPPFTLDFDRIEYAVMQWAEENPEPVYPTWIEWLQSLGVIPYLSGYVAKRDGDGNYLDGHVNVNEVAHKPIPADIAEKHRIEPKEVV